MRAPLRRVGDRFVEVGWDEALDAIATAMDRDRSYLLNEAVQLYLELHQWQIAEIQQGIQEADAGDFASDEEVAEVFARLTDAAS